MGPIAALTSTFVNIFNFSGRATRSEFWWFFMTFLIIGLIALMLDVIKVVSVVSTEGEFAIYAMSPFNFYSLWLSLFISIPYLSLSIRRLHDAGFSGFWWLLSFVPLGGLALLALHCLPSVSRQNGFGQAPSGAAESPGRPIAADAEKRAMQGYACLFEVDREPTPDMLDARKAEVSEYYRSRVLGGGPGPEAA